MIFCRLRDISVFLLIFIFNCFGSPWTFADAQKNCRTNQCLRISKNDNGARFISRGARVVAFGDVHGDVTAVREVLRGIGVIDKRDNWIGENSIVVQVGDQLDRGDTEREVMALFAKLAVDSRRHGGAFFALLGNHEVMNVQNDFRYVSEDGFEQFAEFSKSGKGKKGRRKVFQPGGLYARMLAKQYAALIVDRTLFVHGGMDLEHAQMGIETLNRDVRRWMRDEDVEPEFVDAEGGPFWNRQFGRGEIDCRELKKVLRELDVDRMVVGHTWQKDGVTSACGDRIWRLDVGIATDLGHRLQALEIRSHKHQVRPHLRVLKLNKRCNEIL